MTLKQGLSRLLAMLLVVALIGTTGFPAPASARLVATDEALATAQIDGSRAAIGDWLARDEVRAQMLALGVDPAEVDARVALLGDEEVRELAGRLDTLPAGGSVLGVLFAVFIVLLVTDILGLTKVFPFTQPVR
ncbi:MAG TPA: PA2779 family protein [Burkholderiaceae bacterium]|nr:PA2779 family protein [Burkholderiaceae bacterium]